MKTKYSQALLIFCGLLLSGASFAQDNVAIHSVFDYLTQEEGAQILLELDMDSLMQNRKNADYIPAVLTDQLGKSFSLEVRTRGKFRRARCEIPPIKLKFRKDSLYAEQLNAMNEIKLVLPCNNSSNNEELILREYIAYRMYEHLSPDCCVRARFIRLGLKDKNKRRPKKMYALLVEHEEQVSSRISCSIVQDWGVKAEQLNMDNAAMMALFQYMIGNTDWEIVSCRNVMLLQPPDSAKIIPVPYDFDFSGLVSAPYSSPSAESGVLTVLDRYLMADGIDEQAIIKARNKILLEKEALYAMCKNEYLSKASSNQMESFLDVFFEAIENSEEIPGKLEFARK